ncbi:ABC transporter transmembrane domain-containing protein [Aliirhizobium smilacinae]|uniref:ATP-binding cassette domain-containing protein n=1 Tax=Aliirhizobium smilacinae TaxID=1395944 RepID=A0A5C4XEJ1_9HYPH|nr:ABC transporter transmembrane domain-containing protein [Rhizobium smilacinae]TNM61915.1 ATP-binding cassette domain-containing protein [Rhizobium smilacinae]
MERSLLRYIWSHTRRQQLWILLVVAASMVPYFLAFDLPKQIVNGPIQGNGFEATDARQPFFRIAYELPLIGHVELANGIDLDRPQTLMALSTVFLVLVLINGLFKFYINTYKGRLGERMLRRIRFELVDRVLRFPPKHFKRLKSAEIATMVKDEVEPLGGFTGDAFVLPALLGGQALTTLGFIFVQNVWLGTITAGIVTIQLSIIPRMRRRVLELGRLRQLTARELSGRVSEIVDGIGAVHSNDTSNLERADIAWRLGRIFSIRYDLYQWKFLVKFINNLFSQVTPFIFYAFGGYFVLLGKLDLGQLVAVIAAYKDLPSPLKDLIDWDQARQDVQLKYGSVCDQFSVEPLIAQSVHELASGPVALLETSVVVRNLTLVDDSGARLLDDVSTEIKPDETVALVGAAGSGAEAFAEALGRLIWPESGSMMIGDRNLLEIPESITGRRISYASGEPFLLHGSLMDNLLYGLKHAPQPNVAASDENPAELQRYAAEARKAGNVVFVPSGDWVDYQSVGANGPDDLLRKILPILDAVQISDDIFGLTLRSTLDAEVYPIISERIAELRLSLRKRLVEERLEDLLVPFDFDRYNIQASIGENLLFGTRSQRIVDDKDMVAHPYFQLLLETTGLDRGLYDMGLEIAETAVELFRDLAPQHSFFRRLTFMTAEEIPVYQATLSRCRGQHFEEVSSEDRASITVLSLSYIEPSHRFGLLSEALMERLVAARKLFHTDIPDDMASLIDRHDPERFTASATLLDNVLFGRVAHQVADAAEHIRTIMKELFSALGLYENALAIGLQFDVGAGGKRLALAQRQKLNLARALLKHSDFTILNRPLSALDQRIEEEITRCIIQQRSDMKRASAVLWVISDPHIARIFDRVLLFQRGSLIGSGDYLELSQSNAAFRELMELQSRRL